MKATIAQQCAPVFEGFAIETSTSSKPQDVQQLIYKHFKIEFTVQAYGHQSTNFDLIAEEFNPTVREAWEMAYDMDELSEIACVEPLFAAVVEGRPDWIEDIELPNEEDSEDFTREYRSVLGTGSDEHLPESQDLEWALKEMRVFQAWERFFPGHIQKPPGQKIIIGHPDTGYRQHPEIKDNLLIEQGYDFIDGETHSDPLDELEEPFGVIIPNPGHGTSAASVIVSPRGGADCLFVTGVAPGAALIPYRTTYSVVLWPQSVLNLARSIERAVKDQADVISVSMGAVQSSGRLRQAVREAQSQGVIVLGAAGNYIPWVAPPASIDEVISVAASNAKQEIWQGSISRIGEVDVSAPGESVWRARAIKNDQGQVKFPVERGSGTTFSVALTAGVAALWLDYHGGRQALAQRLGGSDNLAKIPTLFKKILKANCRKIDNWDTRRGGVGIVNAEDTLSARLEEYIDDVAMPDTSMQEVGFRNSEALRELRELFGQSPSFTDESKPKTLSDTLDSQLSELLNVSPEELPNTLSKFGQELAFRFSTNPDSYKAFAKTLTSNGEVILNSETSMTNLDGIKECRSSLLSKDMSRQLTKQMSKQVF
ncbi:S8 family peptidase [Acaryochloris thomasi]|nr:S8/S53 family peptidase [Acaryochloris thomasi]